MFEMAMEAPSRNRSSSRLRSLGDSTKTLKREKARRKPKLRSTGNATIVSRAR